MDPYDELPLPSEVAADLAAGGGTPYELPPVAPTARPGIDIGVNLGWFGAEGTVDSVPFVNQLKGAGPWWSWGDGRIDFDADGYPADIPANTVAISKILNRSPDLEGIAPFTGDFRLYGAGSGTLFVAQGADKLVGDVDTATLPREIVDGTARWYVDFSYSAPADGGRHVALKLTDTNAADRIDDLVLVHHSHLDELRAGQTFAPEFLADIDGFEILRFMEWMQVIRYENDAQMNAVAPEARYVGPDHFTFNTRWGDAAAPNVFAATVPIEHVVELANTVGADAWINLPVDITDSRAGAIAGYVAANLDPGLEVYWEYGNELWADTPGFEGYPYAEARGQSLFGLDGKAAVAEWGAWRGSQLHDVLSPAFAADPDRANYVGAMSSYDPPNVGTWTNADSYSRAYFDGAGAVTQVAALQPASWSGPNPDWSRDATGLWTAAGTDTLVLESARGLDPAIPYRISLGLDPAASGDLRLRVIAAGGGVDTILETTLTVTGPETRDIDLGALPAGRDMLRVRVQWVGGGPLELALSGVEAATGSGPVDHVTDYASSLYAGVTDNRVTAHVLENYADDSVRAAALARWALFGLDPATSVEIGTAALSAPVQGVDYVPGMSISVSPLLYDDIRAGLDPLADLDRVLRLNGAELQYRGLGANSWTTVMSFAEAPAKGLGGLISDVELIGYGFWGFGGWNSGLQTSLFNQSWIRLDGHDDFVAEQDLDWMIYEGGIVLPATHQVFETFEAEGWRAHLLAIWLDQAEKFGVDGYLHFMSHNRTAVGDSWGLRDYAGQPDPQAPTAAYLDGVTGDTTPTVTSDPAEPDAPAIPGDPKPPAAPSLLPDTVADFAPQAWQQRGNWTTDGQGAVTETQQFWGELMSTASIPVDPGGRYQLSLAIGSDVAAPGALRVVVQAVGGGADIVKVWEQPVAAGEPVTMTLDTIPADRDGLRILFKRRGAVDGALSLSSLALAELSAQA